MYQSKIFGFKVKYSNQKEFKISKNEIFLEQIYSIKLENSKPFIIDVGSHIGLSIIYFKSIYPQSTILGFEPNPISFDILNENLNQNGLMNNVVLHNIGLSNIIGSTKLYIDNSNDLWNSNSSLVKGSWTGKEKLASIDIRVNKLSTFIERKVDLLKIDVEGSELKILEDLDNSKKFELINNLLIEYHPNVSFKGLTGILINNGYNLRYIQNGKEVLSPDISNLTIVKASK